MLIRAAVITAGLMLLPAVSQAEFPNPGRYGGFVPPQELERLKNIDPNDASKKQQKDEQFDPYFAVENDPWNKLSSPFERPERPDRPDRQDPPGLEKMKQEADEMRARAQRFISERELEMLENNRPVMRFGGPGEQHNVWGDLNASDDQSAPPIAPAPTAPAGAGPNYPYGGYAPPQTQQWQPVMPGFPQGYAPGYGGYQQRGYNNAPYMYPAGPSPYMMNSIAPFLY